MLIKYKGCELKSGHEFAWAQTFEAEGLDWTYETFIFRSGRYSYTPDFPINQGMFFIEIKPFGGNIKNRIELCNKPLFIIFGMPERHYIRFKPAMATRLNMGHSRSWKLTLQGFLHDIAA